MGNSKTPTLAKTRLLNHQTAIYILVLFICAGCDIHPLGWAVMFAVLRPPEGIVVGVIIAVVWLIYFLTRRD